MPDQIPEQTQTPDVNAQAKAALPQPEYMAPGEDLTQGTKLQKAYDAASAWLSEHEKNISEEYLKPFRQGLDRMAEDLQQAGESGHTKSGGQMNEPTRALASGVGSLLEQVPVGKDAKSTALMAATDYPFKDIEGVRPATPKEIIEHQGLVYKGEMVPTSKVHMFEHPDHPGKTAALFEHEITPDSVKSKMDSKIKDFADGEQAKQVAKNASGDSAASQEAINRAASEKSKGESYFRIDSRSRKETPLSSIDGVDAKPGPYEFIVKRTKTGDTVMDSGEKAKPLPPKSAPANSPNSPTPKAEEMTKKVSDAAEKYLASLKKSKP